MAALLTHAGYAGPDACRLMGLTVFDVNFKQGEAERWKIEGLIEAEARPFKKLRNT